MRRIACLAQPFEVRVLRALGSNLYVLTPFRHFHRITHLILVAEHLRLREAAVEPFDFDFHQPEPAADMSKIDAALGAEDDLVFPLRFLEERDVACDVLELSGENALTRLDQNDVDPAVHLAANEVVVVELLHAKHGGVQLALVLQL